MILDTWMNYDKTFFSQIPIIYIHYVDAILLCCVALMFVVWLRDVYC